MTTWASDYVADVPYTHGFYHELSPAFLRFAGQAAAVNAPDPEAGSPTANSDAVKAIRRT